MMNNKLPCSREDAKEVSQIIQKSHTRMLSQRNTKTQKAKYFFNALMELRINSNLDFLEMVEQYRRLHSTEEIPLSVQNIERTGRKLIFFDLDETLIFCEVRQKRKYDHTFKLSYQNYGLIERPGLYLLLDQLKDCDLAIFSAASPSYAQKIISIIDKEGKYFKHLFTKKNCAEHNEAFYKDLSVMNRNLQDVILVDNSPVCASLYRDNYVPITTFRGKSSDTQLIQLGQYLQLLIKEDDVRLKIRSDFKIEFLH